MHPLASRGCNGSNTSPPDSRQILISPCSLIYHHNHPFSIFYLCRLLSPPLPVALGPFYRLYHVPRIADPYRLQTLRQTHGHVITADAASSSGRTPHWRMSKSSTCLEGTREIYDLLTSQTAVITNVPLDKGFLPSLASQGMGLYGYTWIVPSIDSFWT